MTIPGSRQRVFHTSAELQEFLLTQPAGGLIIVPHRRLAHQVWRRQRLAARAAGKAAWEPVAMMTLSGWWQRLWDRLWLPARSASTLERLLLWLEAMATVPSEAAVAPDLSWAACLDETFDLVERYQLPPPNPLEMESTLINWRQAIRRQFTTLMAERGLMTSGAKQKFLLEALSRGEVSLPEQLTLVGLETPASVEEQWFLEVSRLIPVLQVHLTGRQEADLTQRAVAFPDRRQEMEWVAAQVLELAIEKGVPWHRLAITGPNLETYLPDLRRICQEVLGTGVTETGGLYNFSLGPTLAETLVFQTALLPLKFILEGEQRQDLMAWLRCPLYGAFRRGQNTLLHWDVAWRQGGVAYGWQALKKARSEMNEAEPGETIGLVIHQALSLLPADLATAAVWRDWLLGLWDLLDFPFGLDSKETGHWRALLDLLGELAGAAGERPWTAAALVEWLSWGAGRLEQPGEGSSEAGLQIQGLLELRGLDFEAVFCLGLNMGVLPPPPRHLPLLSSREKALVLGGDYASQREFAESSYRYLLASAPMLILTRPLVDQDEDRLASPVIPPLWEKDPLKFAALSQPHPAWLRSPAVRAAFQGPAAGQPEVREEGIAIRLPEVISLSALETALTCPCWFYLSMLLGLEVLPEIQPGLPALERGRAVHEVLHTFTCQYGAVLETTGEWDDVLARQYLQEVVRDYQLRGQDDPHWQAECDRWLAGEGALLEQWLGEEKKRFVEGWRWLATEESFSGLQVPGWPTTVRGRLDRVDGHDIQGVLLWDYKTGAVPNKKDIVEERSSFQLPGYLLAVQQGLTSVPPPIEARAGIIGLKSSREEHLKYEDYTLTAAAWQKIVQAKVGEVARLGSRVGEGDFRPDPSLPPPAQNNSCRYCPFALLCGYDPEVGAEAEA